ncbi:MAG TPA: threonine/serine dehydratase [Parvibaculum sp.]|jgi:threonine dehydratase
MSALPTSADVHVAAARLQGVAVRTPLLECAALNALTGGRIFIKPEVLQRTGSFKFRGAYNRLSQLTPDERKGGIVAWSSGNHAQGVAAAAALLGIKARIVMPADAPRIKTERTQALGAEIVLYDRLRDDREAIGRALAAEHGAIVVPPYDDPQIIAGQGTVGLEIADDASRLGVTLDAALIPAGGGGLIAGVSLALAEASPATKIFSVEPSGFDDHRRSLAVGARLRNEKADVSFCDALMAPTPGGLTFEINRARLAGGFAVTDDEVAEAMRFAFMEMKLAVEPGGAVALAAMLTGKIDARGKAVAIVLSGGNVDPELFAKVIA